MPTHIYLGWTDMTCRCQNLISFPWDTLWHWSPICLWTRQAKKFIPSLPPAVFNQCEIGIGVEIPQLPCPSSRSILSHGFWTGSQTSWCDWALVAHSGKGTGNALFVCSFPSLTRCITHLTELPILSHKVLTLKFVSQGLLLVRLNQLDTIKTYIHPDNSIK